MGVERVRKGVYCHKHRENVCKWMIVWFYHYSAEFTVDSSAWLQDDIFQTNYWL